MDDGALKDKIDSVRALVENGPPPAELLIAVDDDDDDDDDDQSSTHGEAAQSGVTSTSSEAKATQKVATRHSIAGLPSHGIISTIPAHPISSKNTVEHILRKTMQQSVVKTSISEEQYERVAHLIADAVATLTNAAVDSSVVDNTNSKTEPQEHNALLNTRANSGEVKAHAGGESEDTHEKNLECGDNERAIRRECDLGGSGWPFTHATIGAIQDAKKKTSTLHLEGLLGVHLALGMQCRMTHEENMTLHHVIEHMKEESTKRQRQQQEQINTLKSRLKHAESAIASCRCGIAPETYTAAFKRPAVSSQSSTTSESNELDHGKYLQPTETKSAGKSPPFIDGKDDDSRMHSPNFRRHQSRGNYPSSVASPSHASPPWFTKSEADLPRRADKPSLSPKMRHNSRNNKSMSNFSLSSPRSVGGSTKKKKLHMSTSDQARARKSIRQALIHLADKYGHRGGTGSAAGIHLVWEKVFKTHTLRGESSLGVSEFRRALRSAMGISSAELSDTHVRGLFQTIDDTEDGFIEFQEFRDWLMGSNSKRRKSLQALNYFNHSDSSGQSPEGVAGNAPTHQFLSRVDPRDRAKAAQEYQLSQKQARAIPAKPESLMQRLGMVHRSHRAAQRQSSPRDQSKNQKPLVGQKLASTTLLDDPYLLSHPSGIHSNEATMYSNVKSIPSSASPNRREEAANGSEKDTSKSYTPWYMHSQMMELKSSYRKEYALHLNDSDLEGATNNMSQADGGGGVMFERDAVGKSSDTRSGETQSGEKKPRKRRATIISPKQRQETLLRMRKEEKERAQEQLQKWRNDRMASTKEQETLEEDFDFRPMSDSPDYDTLIKRLDKRLTIGQSDVRSHRDSYTGIAENVSKSLSEKDIDPKGLDSLQPSNAATHAIGLSHEKRAPTWVLTQGIEDGGDANMQ